MSGLDADILREIFYKDLNQKSLPISDLQVLTGKSAAELRPHLEDLKQKQLIFEHSDEVELSSMGRHY